jgi:hypothetical protein
MPNGRQQTNGQQGKPQAGKTKKSRSQRQEQRAPEPKAKRSFVDKTSPYSGIAAVLVAIVAAVFAILTYVNQSDANSAINTSAQEQFASKVSYVLETQGNNQELQITNRSIGAISNLEMIFPQPIQGCGSPSSCGGWEGYFYADLSNIPACEVLTSDVLGDFIKPKIDAKSLNSSHLNFTDQDGNTWGLFAGEDNKLIPLTESKAPTGVVTIPSKGFTPANGCS